jgi:hypothetical protein
LSGGDLCDEEGEDGPEVEKEAHREEERKRAKWEEETEGKASWVQRMEETCEIWPMLLSERESG